MGYYVAIRKNKIESTWADMEAPKKCGCVKKKKKWNQQTKKIQVAD